MNYLTYDPRQGTIWVCELESFLILLICLYCAKHTYHGLSYSQNDEKYTQNKIEFLEAKVQQLLQEVFLCCPTLRDLK